MSRLKSRVEKAERNRRAASGVEVVEVPANLSAAQSDRQASAELARRGVDTSGTLVVVLRRFAQQEVAQ